MLITEAHIRTDPRGRGGTTTAKGMVLSDTTMRGVLDTGERTATRTVNVETGMAGGRTDDPETVRKTPTRIGESRNMKSHRPTTLRSSLTARGVRMTSSQFRRFSDPRNVI